MVDEKAFQGKVDAMVADLYAACPGLAQMVGGAVALARHRDQTALATLRSVNESLDNLRVGQKYLLLDVEASRRENGYLRKILEETGQNNGGGGETSDDQDDGGGGHPFAG